MAELTKERIVNLLLRRDEVGMHAIGRALLVLHGRQTHDEQRSKRARHNNSRGFTPADSRMGTSHAEYYRRYNRLTEKQVAYWLIRNRRGQPRITKYWAQLLEEAKYKQAQKENQLLLDNLES